MHPGLLGDLGFHILFWEVADATSCFPKLVMRSPRAPVRSQVPRGEEGRPETASDPRRGVEAQRVGVMQLKGGAAGWTESEFPPHLLASRGQLLDTDLGLHLFSGHRSVWEAGRPGLPVPRPCCCITPSGPGGGNPDTGLDLEDLLVAVPGTALRGLGGSLRLSAIGQQPPEPPVPHLLEGTAPEGSEASREASPRELVLG